MGTWKHVTVTYLLLGEGKCKDSDLSSPALVSATEAAFFHWRHNIGSESLHELGKNIESFLLLVSSFLNKETFLQGGISLEIHRKLFPP